MIVVLKVLEKVIVLLHLLLAKRMKVATVVLAALTLRLVRTAIVCSKKLNIDTKHNNSHSCSSNYYYGRYY